MKRIIFVALLLACSTVFAKEAYLTGFVSRHFVSNHERFNESNTGVGYRSANNYAVMCYTNSYYRNSCFAGVERLVSVFTDHVKVGFIAGALTGYVGQRAVPIVMPELVFATRGFEVALTGAPGIGDRIGFAALQFRYALK